MSFVWPTLVMLVVAGSVLAQESDPVALYRFESEAALAADSSGNRHDGRVVGGATWTSGDFGGALNLNGEDAYLDCGAAEGLNISARGSVTAWCRPESLQGGIVNWSTGGNWGDERLVLAINTYGGAQRMMGCIANGRSFQQLALDNPPVGEWTHFAITFSGTEVRTYQDGVLVQAQRQAVPIDVAGVPLWIGRCQGLGKDFFQGQIDEVAVFSRVLSAEDVLARYKADAGLRGKDTSYFNRPRVSVQAYPGPGCILASVDARQMQPLPDRCSITVTLRSADGRRIVGSRDASPVPPGGAIEAVFDVQPAAPGPYEVVATVRDGAGASVGDPAIAAVEWKGQPPEFAGVKVLNNMVWELLDLKAAEGITGEQAFAMPRSRWALLRTTANLRPEARVTITVDGEDAPAIVHDGEGSSTIEAFRCLPAGQHKLTVRVDGEAKLTRIVARSVPMLQHAFYGANPHIHPYGPYDWEFLSQYVLPHVNTMVGSPGPELEGFKQQGKKWIAIIGLPKLTAEGDAAVDEAYAHWSGSPGLQNPLMDGIIVDEFGGGDEPVYDTYRQAVERIYANDDFAGKAFYPYGGTFYGDDRSARFAQAAVDGGGLIAWERYLIEQPSEEAAAAEIRRAITDEMSRWEQRFPNAADKMLMVLGYMSQPTESLNVDPSANYKVYMDMQFQALATHPACFGLAGVQEYHSSYCDEENVRWAALLYRHYCLEGSQEAFTKEPYTLKHLQNPDFASGTEGWSLQPAEDGSIRAGRHEGYSWLEGRYPRTAQGDTFLITKRSSKGPNTFSQLIAGLKPGRLYSLKMITADYQDLIGEVSRKAENAVSITIDGVEVQQEPKDSFQFTFPSCYAHVLGKFDQTYPFYMNYHWRVFRANAATAQLTVSDWATPTDPGGPEGQEIVYNFLELQPYLQR